MTNILSQQGQERKLGAGRRSVSAHEALRRLRGFSVVGLARAAGVDHSLVSRVERGQRPPTAVYRQRVSRALGVTEAELFPDMGESP